ncbi:hypothetical protein Pla175_32750 [Pirellulimonas nuda]|uniref:IRE (Iron responsive element) n=1 Tax=Pirellulimonas nuda TaxID=2528009 RepID=A0A518DEH7_9BACT|nr:hypothetical protein [Pirellulimonas nuda]QDU89879.1 hypothetical protein Pla175_32750 [Pirellulimonas nuda]
MNERTTLYRKLAYVGIILALLFPLNWLAAPQTRDSPGGKLAQIREQEDLGQGDLGEIDPASEAAKLATFGLRGVAAQFLWNQAIEYKRTENWTALTATLEQLAKLQPNFLSFWEFQSWNLAYNVSTEFDDYHDRYYYVRRGIQFLEQGLRYNRANPKLLWDMGWTVGHKIGRADEKEQYRRLFKADDQFHPEDRPPAQRDNWLVSRDYYEQAIEAADSGKGYGKKSPVLFYDGPGKSQMNYAEAVEDEGRFETGLAAWRVAEDDWRTFGQRPVEHSTGVILHLADEPYLTDRVAQLTKELEGMAPGLREELVEQRRQKLTEAERVAIDTPEAARTTEQFDLAYQAQSAIKVSGKDLAEAIAKKTPSERRKALALADELARAEIQLRYTDSYKDTSNYDYWMTRAMFEQTPEAVEARKLIFQGRKTAKEEFDVIAAADYYRRGLEKWRVVLDAFPELWDPDGTTGDDVMQLILEYNKLLESNDQTLPDDFPLWQIVEDFDAEQDLAQQLAEHKQRTAGGAKPAEEKTPADEAKPEPKPEPNQVDEQPSEEQPTEENKAEPKQPEESQADASPEDAPGADTSEADQESSDDK